MLKGEAKTKYMRDYMRRKRAGLPTAKPKQAGKPSQRTTNDARIIRELEAEVARERKRREAAETELAYHRKRLETDRAHEQIIRRMAKPTAPLTADAEREIQRLKNRNRELRKEVHHLREMWRTSSRIPEKGGMSFKTHGTIMKALHPEGRKRLTEKELHAALDAACGAFNAWTDSLRPRRN